MTHELISEMNRLVDRIHLYGDTVSSSEMCYLLKGWIKELATLQDRIESEYVNQAEFIEKKNELAEAYTALSITEGQLRSIKKFIEDIDLEQPQE